MNRDDRKRTIIGRLLGRRTWSSADLRVMFTVQQVAEKLCPELPAWAFRHGLPVVEMVERGWLPELVGYDGWDMDLPENAIDAALCRFFDVASVPELLAVLKNGVQR